MAFPRRLLADDEQVVLDLHPHWKRLVIPALLVPAVAGVASYAVFVVPSGDLRTPLRWAAVGVAALVLLRWSLWPWVRWITTRYVVTTHRLAVRSGVFSRHGRDLPLGRVTDVSYRRTLGERLVRSGTLVFESAGEGGQVVLTDVPDVEFVQREVYRLLRHARHA